jgi:acyl-CoA synthetase (AMP-forming)/AMP-acid ligase II
MDLLSPLSAARRVKVGSLGPLPDVPFNLKTLMEAGVIRPMRPDKVARVFLELARWGASPAGGITGAAITNADGTMLMDEAGSLTFGEVHRRSNALARALAQEGVRAGDGVAIMARNHRGFIETTLAVSKLGANGLYMNTAFSGPQLVDVMEREGPAALVYDEEFAELLGEAKEDVRRYVSWSEDGSSGDTPIEEMISASDDSDLSPPDESSRFVILTSGTTGTPKGAQRQQPDSLSPLAALFSRIPLRAGEPTMIAAPMFHSWGFAHFMLGLSLNSIYVLQRRFNPEATLQAIEEREATALVVVPVMMQRILQLPEETLAKYDLPTLRVTAASGSALPGRLANEWMDHFGENLYNPTGRPRWRGRRSRPRATCARRPAPRGSHREGPWSRSSIRTATTSCHRARRGASSSATRWPSRATRAAAARTNTRACSPRAMSAISTTRAACSSTAATTR